MCNSNWSSHVNNEVNNEVNDEVNVEVHAEANIEANVVANIEANVAANDVPFDHAPAVRSVSRYAAARMAHVTFERDYAEANDVNFQRVFAGRDFSRIPVAQYIMRLQRFHFRHTTSAFRTLLFNQWLARQPSHNEILHATQECDVCSTRFDEIENVALRNQLFLFQVLGSHYLKHIACGHSICSSCLLEKRFIFVNLGLEICCNVCSICWLQF